jgi:hypothetical protein
MWPVAGSLQCGQLYLVILNDDQDQWSQNMWGQLHGSAILAHSNCLYACLQKTWRCCDGTVKPSYMVDELLSRRRPLQWPVVLPSWKVVTWLILPVVICLSQRLSHASLSINKFILWNCERLIKSVIVYLMISYYMDNCGNSRANTCTISPDFWKGCIY